jgi:flagellar biosynthetic protein FliR
MSRAIAIDSGWIVCVLLLSLRLAAMFLATPLLAAASVPVSVRVVFVVGLAAALSLGMPELWFASRPALANPATLMTAACTELALGATLSLGILLCFAAFSLAGRLLDVQMGFGLGQVIDPASKAQLPVVTSAFAQVSVLVFFLVDGHHALLRGLAYSLERFPLGRGWAAETAVAPVLKQVAGLFSLGFALAAPVAFSLLLLEMGLGVITRNLPQINMLALGIPAKVSVGLLALSFWFGGIGNVMARVYGELYRNWGAIFAAAEVVR